MGLVAQEVLRVEAVFLAPADLLGARFTRMRHHGQLHSAGNPVLGKACSLPT